MEAAIHDIPTIYHTNVAKQMEQMLVEDNDDNDEIVEQTEQVESDDDPFILIMPNRNEEYKSAGIGITQIGNRFKTHFYSGGDFEFVSTEINITPNIDADEQQPLDQSSVLIR